jgi:TolA-binding protein
MYCPAILILLVSAQFVSPQYLHAAPPPFTEKQTAVPGKPSENILLQKASVAFEKGNRIEAADLLVQFNELYPNSSRAEESLWRAAQIYKIEAQQSNDPDWEKVRDIFRRYFTYFQDTKRGEEAFLEVGIANFYMHSLREAQTYVNLFLERYPKSELLNKAKYWQAKILVSIGREEEAEKIYLELVKTNDKELQKTVYVTLVDLYYSLGKYQSALDMLMLLIKRTKVNSPEYLEVIKKQGVTLTRLGKGENIKKGRELLYYYLNIVESSALKDEALFELAESYYRENNDATAQKLYNKIVEKGDLKARPFVLSRFRQAQYLDDPKQKLEKWQKKGDLEDSAGDAPYFDVLNTYFSEPISQDARYGLFLRYMARKDYDQAFQIGKGFLKFGKDKFAEAEKDQDAISGDILVLIVENLLKNGEFKKVYDLYVIQHDYVNNYEHGRLQYLVGQAMEGLYLYDQAAVVYYRALGLPLTEVEKTDLYFRRVAVYLAQEDWKSADRLLKHLREKVFKEKKEIGKVFYSSGRLEEIQGNLQEALLFYTKSIEKIAFSEKKEEYASAQLRVMLALAKYDLMKKQLVYFHNEGWLSGSGLQEWYSSLGNVYFAKKDFQNASQMFLSVVGKDMPPDGKLVQEAHLRLGDVFAALGDDAKSKFHYQKAGEGEGLLKKKIAEERLRQNEIDQVLLEVGGLLKK